MRTRTAWLAAVAAVSACSSTTERASCSGDPVGIPGVVVDYGEVVRLHPEAGAVHAKACFGQVCRETDSNGPLGARFLVPLANASSPATTVSLKTTDPHGATLLDTQDTFTVPTISGGAGCGVPLWELSLVVHDGRLTATNPIKLTPEPAATSS
ncbi:MAG: hypothetical protein JF587_00580 [Catenulisporales bacterium]|jgi:hypothetical protein|nr:hypothetical protein [Catenulisporales bacterium]